MNQLGRPTKRVTKGHFGKSINLCGPQNGSTRGSMMNELTQVAHKMAPPGALR